MPYPSAFRPLFALLLAAALLAAVPAPASAAPTVTNPGFEGLGSWTTTGTAAADYTESGGRSGSRLTHWSSSAYTVRTYQTLTGLSAGNYTLGVYVKNGGGQGSVHVGLENCGSSDRRTSLPVTPDWVKVVVSTSVSSSGNCTIVLSSNANSGNWASFDDVSFASGATSLSVKGADVSTLAKSEAFGGRYFDAAGTQRDPLALLRDNGANYARLKVWVNPADGYHNKARVLDMARRIKALNMGLLIDFHYSDAWADPGQQFKPGAWRPYSFTQLRQAVYDHTYDVLNALRAQGTTADMVQVGNEINDGMLWEDGRASGNFSQLAQLLNAGHSATKAVSSSTRVLLHLADGATNSLYRWFFDNCRTYGVNYDVIAASYYSFWHGTLAAMQANLTDVSARYGKPVMVVETAYPFTTGNDDNLGNIINAATPYAGYPASTAGQAAMFRDVMSVVQAVPGALGVFYWEPTWTAVTGNGWDPTDPSSGNGWENQAMFGFNDRALPVLSEFGHQ